MSKRLNLNLNDEEWEFLQDLSEKRNEPVSHVIRESIRLRRVVAAAQAAGQRITVEGADGELVIL